MDRQRNTLTRAIEYFTGQRVWGTITVIFNAGRIEHVKTIESVRPSQDRRLAAIVGNHPDVVRAIQAGETKEFVFARLRSGQLTLLAIETHCLPEQEGGDLARDRGISATIAE